MLEHEDRIMPDHAMPDIRVMTEGDPIRQLAQEAVLQLKMCRGDTARAVAETEKYAERLGLGKSAVKSTILGSYVLPTDLPLL